MGNQLTGIAPSQILPVEQYLTDVPDYEYDSSLGSTRFLKVARAVTKEGLAVVKVFVIHDPSLPLSSHRIRLEEIHNRLKETSNCLAFQKPVQSDKSALLFRQYVKDSLYDRISTRPFLNKIEKKWIAFQLLCALNQAHKVKVCHGDIKSENVMITSWSWLLLTDFASFKPTYLPEDNPSDFSYFFDTSRRRTCYIAPERFVASTWQNSERDGQVGNLDLPSNEIKTGDLTPAMDIFSAGCVIAELFTEGTAPFDLSQLLSYRNGEYSPWKVISKIDDAHVKELVEHMLHKDPCYRLSAEEYLIKQRNKAFPEHFYTFLKQHIQRFASPPILTPDDRIYRLNSDMEMIVKSLSIQKDQCELNNVLVLIISLVTSSCRQLHFCNSKLTALSVLLDLSKYLTPDITLDRVIPYMLHFAEDPYPQVRAETVRTITRCLSNIKSVPRSDANVFPEYIFPNLSHLTQDHVALVRAAYAENIAQLADTALSVLEMMQLGDNLDEDTQADTEDDSSQQQSSYDMELQSLQETIQQKVVLLLSDSENVVKQTLIENGITRLCVFFGRQKANDVLLSHMITFLNNKEDWKLRGSFFDNIVGVAAYVGWQSSSILKPLMQQGLNDPEEFVVQKSLGALKALTELGLLQKPMLHDFVQDVVAYLAHPNVWIRQAAVGFISSVAKILNIADIHCDLLPSLQPFLKQAILQVDKEVLLLTALEEAVPRSVFDYIIRSSLIERLFDILHHRNYMRSIGRQGHKPIYELDENMSQIFRKLSSLGMTESHEDRILAMKDYILKLHRARAGSAENSLSAEDRARRGRLNIITDCRSVTRRHADLYRAKNPKSESENIPSSRRKKKNVVPESLEMNSEWKSMFGSDSSGKSLSLSPQSKMLSRTEGADKKLLTLSGSSQSSSGSMVNVASTDSLVKQHAEKHTTHTQYAKCRLELKNLVHKCRNQYAASISSKDLLDSIAWDSHSPPNNWKPKGALVAHLQEHRAAVNRIQVSQDHSYFATCSDDGTIKVWECNRLEGKSVANRSKCTIKQGGKVKTVAFLEGTQSTTLASAADTGSINLYRVDAGRASIFLKQDVDLRELGQVVDLSHFDTGSQSVLAYATVYGYLIGWDLRSPEIAWKLKNDPKTGLIQSFAVHHSQCWLSLGTSSGAHVCWDLRFQLPITTVQHPTSQDIFADEAATYVPIFGTNQSCAFKIFPK
ncbi:hypothetical protein ScPMuIL_009701 [Solemya velum]